MILRLRAEADWLFSEAFSIQCDPGRAVNHPPTKYTAQAAGAKKDEPFNQCPRALRSALLCLGFKPDMADQLLQDAGKNDERSSWQGSRCKQRRLGI